MRAPTFSLARRLRVLAGSPRARRIGWWIAGLLVAFAIAGFFIAPPLAKSQLEARLSQALHRPVTIQTVRINPFAPSITLRGFAVRERDGGAPFASFDELYVNAAWTSVLRLAPVVDQVTLVKPRLHVVRNADRSYNFQDLLEAFRARPPAEGPPPKFALFNLRLLDGRIDFEDRAEDETHVVSDLRVGIPFLSSLPAHADIEVLPELSASVNGAHLALGGEALPFAGTHATHLKLDLDGFDLTRLVDYLPSDPRGKLQSALLDTRLVIAFEQPAGKPAELKLRGSAALRKLAVLEADGRPALAWQRLAVELNEVEPLVPRIDLKSLEIDGADVRLRRASSGALNLAQLGPAPARGEAQKASASAPGSAPLELKIDRVALNVERFGYTDQTTRPAFETVLEDGEIRASGFDLQQGKRSQWTLAARSDAGETVRLAGDLTIAPFAAQGRLDIAGGVLKRYQPYMDQGADLRIDDGRADLGFAFEWTSDGFKADAASLAIHGLRARLPDEKQPFLRVGSLEMKGAGIDVAARTANLGEITAAELAADLRRAKDGVLNVSRIARPGKDGESAPSRPWRVDLAQASLERGALTFEDLAPAQPVRLRIAPIALKAERLSTAKGARGNVSLRAGVDRGGTLEASGALGLAPLAARLAVHARAIGFAPLQPYLDEKLYLAVNSGALSAKGTASFEMPAGVPVRAAYQGDVAVTDFASVDKRSTQDLLRWKSLALGAVDFELEPMKLSLGEVALSEYYARIILAADGRLNLQDLVVDKQPPSAPPQASAAAPPRSAGGRNVRIGKITVQGGNVNFSDFFVKPNYSANLTGVGGAVTEMTAEKAGDVELRGKLDDAAPVELAGRLNLLSADLLLHLRGTARDIELPPLSPYAVKYAGYGIERGKLSLNVQYDVENRQLNATNRIFLDQLTFGERVESPTATRLPVTLAVALLKDRNGVIDVDLPISGSLDDPQFSLGGVIVRVIMNLITRAVTAPFALLGSLFGGGEELAYLEFTPGSAELSAGGQAKLKNLATALAERPALRLDVGGRAVPEADREGLKRATIERKVRSQKFNDLRRAGSAPASVDAVKVEPAEYEKYLRQAYREEKFPKPRNALGLVRDLPVAEMENLMLTHTPVGEEDLRQLANERAQAAREWLVEDAKVAAERVFTVSPRLSAEGIKDSGRPTRVDFALK
jgi:uncharacterized protein involved in outer membrane biogenesis